MIEKLKLILIAIISITAPCAKAYQPSHYAASSRLSSGHWVKISVDTTGVFAISHERLRQWGFQNPGNVAVYGFGGGTAAHPLFSADAPDDLPQTPSVHTSDGRLLFFAEGDVTASLPKIQEPTFIRNSADFSSYYFLCEDQTPGQAPQPIPAPDAFDPDDALTFSYAIELIEREVQNPGEAGTEFHGHKLSPGQSEEFRFHVDGFAQGIDGHIGHIFYTCAASSPTSNLNFGVAADGPFDLRYISSTRIERITDNSTFVFRTGHGHCEISPTEGYSPKDSDLSVRITLPASARTRYAAVDKVSLIYPRTTAIGSGAPFTLAYFPDEMPRAGIFSIENAGADLCLWDLSSATPRPMAANVDAESATAYASLAQGVSRVLAFSSSAAFPEPTFQGIVENQDIHALSAPQYLIITTEGMRQYAEELAQIHRTLRGTNVLVLTQDEIFNEFSSGARCPQALRRCIKMFHDRQPGTLTHVLLYGRSHFDQRGIISDRSDRLVCYEMEYINYVIDSTQNAIADTYFGLVDDAYTPLDIFRFPSVVSIGRIPADTPEKARTANEKSRQYMLNPPSPSDFLHALMISDLHDAHAHFLQSEASIDTMAKVRPEFTFSRADGLVYPISDNELKEAQKQTANCLRRGQGYMSYCGHGQPSFIGSLKLWSENLAKETDYSVLPLCLLASCNLFMPDRDNSSLAETMLFKEGGGAIGVIAACRAVYLEQNKVLSNAIAAQYANARPGTTIGEIFRNARLEIISKLPLSAATGVNTICYNLCGDPALPLAVPDHIVDITSINGSAPAEASLPSLVPVAISARILDPEGRPVTDFSGTVCIEVFDAPRTFSTNAAEADDPDSNGRPQSRTALCDEYLLAEHTAQASGGTFSTVIYLPEPAANGQKGRIVITASDPSRGINAAGTVRDVTLSGPGQGHTPAQAPQVMDMYIDTPGFRSGDPVSDSFVLYAQIDCSPAGLDMSNSRIKNGISLVLDGKTSLSGNAGSVSVAPDGTATFSRRFGQLSQGRHTLTLTLANTLGASSSATIDFTVISDGINPVMVLDEDGPARSQATLFVAGLDDEARSIRVIIRDAAGNTVRSLSPASFPCAWDLTDQQGERVPDGRYKASALISTDSAFGHTPEIDIIVLE